MDFRGHLRLPDDAGTGIPVLLRLDDIFVVISSDGDELGAWRADDVVIERIYSNQFAIELDGEPMVFVAHDALGFAYEGISAIEALQERLTKRRVFKRSRKKDRATTVEQEAPEPAATAPADMQPADFQPAELPDTREPTPSAPLDFEETTDEPALSDDAEEPMWSGKPASIWTPPSDSSPSRPAPTGPSDPQPDFEPVIPEPVERRFASQDADARRPEDVRVSYPQPERPPAPAVETFVPPVEPAEPTLDEPARGEPQEPAQPDPVSSEDTLPSEPEPVAVDLPEYEIEEVAPAASGVDWQPRDETHLDEAEPVDEMEIEDYVLPSAGAVETFNPLADEPDPGTAPSQPEAEQVEVAEDIDEELSETDEEVSEGAEEVPETELPVAAPSAPEAPSERPVDTPEVAPAANGHRKDDEVTDETSKRERRHSLFGRSRDKKVPPHEHLYGDPKTIGGLTRKVCEVCGHVTFSGEDVYQGW